MARQRSPRAHGLMDAAARPREEISGNLVTREGVLQLQRTAGNEAVAAALASQLARRGALPGPVQRFGWDDLISAAEWTNPLTFSGKLFSRLTGTEANLWRLAEQAVRASATRISIPQGHVDALKRYARAHPDDGDILFNALDQDPAYYQGGWLLGVQGNAEAITFGNSIFFGSSPPSVRTFVHEMVHIDQYDRLGRGAFLASYFGMSLLTITKRALMGQPIEAMKSSPHERDAYALEGRFVAAGS